MATASIYLSSADSPDCDSCARAKKENEATWYCGDCHENLCSTCHDFHGRLGVSKDHVTNILAPTSPTGQTADGSSTGIMIKSQKRQKGGKQPDGRKQDIKQDSYDQVSGMKDAREVKKTGSKMTGQDQASSELATDVQQLSLGAAPDKHRSSPGVRSSRRHPTYSSVTLMNQFDASHEDDDKPCWITGALVVRDLIILADVNNNKIKVFDMRDFNFICQMHVAYAYDLTQITEDTIAVTSDLDKYFTLFSLKDEGLTEIRRVKTPYYCWGICHHDGLIYVVCQEDATGVAEVDVFTCEGEMKRRLEPLYPGQKVLQGPYYITVNHQTGTLYIADWKTEAVVGLSLSGKVLFNQKVKQCESPGGLAVDDQGQLYVCGLNSHNIIRTSPDGVTSEILVKDTKFPQCLHVHGDELILGCQFTNIVRFYKLS